MMLFSLEKHLFNFKAISQASRSLTTNASTYSQVSSRDKIQKIRVKHLSPAMIPYYRQPLLIDRGRMQYLWDSDGKKYLDLFGGIVTVSVGHCHPRLNERLRAQMDRLWHTTSIYMTPPIHEYAEKLAEKMPGDLKVCYFVNSGSEANDLATLLARLYTGNFEVVTTRNSYHGLTQTLMGATNMSTWKQPAPLGFGFHATVNPDPYRGPWGGGRCRDSLVQTDRKCSCEPDQCLACDKYVEQFEDLLEHSVARNRLAAFMIESIQGVGGAIQFPKEFVKRAFEAARAWGGVCISDEIQTGFGRLGSHFWGFQSHGTTPDIVTLAKGIGNGFPLAAVVTTPDIARSLTKALHFNTYGGNPLACTVGSAVLDVIEEEELQQNCQQVGSYLLEALATMKEEFPFIGDVRGKGLMIGMELVEDKQSRKPLQAAVVADILENIKDAGVLIGKGGLHGNVFRIKPPMCITKQDVDFALEIFRKTLQKVDKQ